MKCLQIPISLIFFLLSFSVSAKDYNISDFGGRADRTTLNTKIIQGAIDYIAENGGGRLIFDQGKYLTGTIFLKSGVRLHLNEGAVILGSTNPFDYQRGTVVGHFLDFKSNITVTNWKALIYAIGQDNIGISGEGTIDGQGFETAYNTLTFVYRGLITDPLRNDRANETNRPVNIIFSHCKNVSITGITLRSPANWNQIYERCTNVYVDSITVDSKSYWNNDGIDILDCDNVLIQNSHLDAADDVLCFKSFDPDALCQNVTVRNCTVRSSANGIKFGSTNKGGFKNFRFSNIKIYNTYRSAIGLENVDGGIVEDIFIDSVEAHNVGNVIFLRLGDRNTDGRVPSYKNITIRNVVAEVSASKPDSGYNYEGPIEDLPRNISPAIITGLPGQPIKDVKLINIKIKYPGGGNPFYAKRGTSKEELESIPEMPFAYPEYSQFKELPAWGFYVRHVDGITFDNVVLEATDADYRPAMVFDDVKDFDIKKNVSISIPESKGKKEIILNNTTKTK